MIDSRPLTSLNNYVNRQKNFQGQQLRLCFFRRFRQRHKKWTSFNNTLFLSLYLIPNILCIHNERIPQFFLLPTLILERDKCNQWQNLCLWFECIANNKDFRILASSIWLSNWHRPTYSSDKNRTTLEERRNTSCHGYIDHITFITSADSFSFVEQIENVSGSLVMNLENGPNGFDFSFSFMRFCFCFSHFGLQFLQCRFNQFPSFRRRFSPTIRTQRAVT